MWTLKFETQGHSTEDTGLTYETPELAYAAVEAFSDRAMDYEQACFDNEVGLEYAPSPKDGDVKGWKDWLKTYGWPEGCIPVIHHDDGRMMGDLGGGFS